MCHWWVVVCALAADAPPADVVVACPEEFRAALEPWVAHRESQGHRLAFVSNEPDAAGIRREIRRHAEGGALRFVVLVGDAEPGAGQDAALRRRSVPTHYVRARVVQRFGSEAEIAGDNWYADLDDDRLPDVAIGRLSVDTPDELREVVAKIIRYETCRDFSPWRRQVDFVAGVGGFGYVIDNVLESATKQVLSGGMPAAFASSMTYGSWQSPYCPDPRRFRDVALGRLNDGCLFWVYIGHGSERKLDYLRVPRKQYPIMEQADIGRLDCRCGAPIACFLACYTAAFDGREDCLAETMLRRPGGPVAVIGGSRVTMPYAMSILGQGLLSECFVKRTATLGEAILAAKRAMVLPPADDDATRRLIETLGRLFSPTPDELATERDEHLDLFNLIGDPLLRLPLPQSLAVRVSPRTSPGETLAVHCDSPVAGRCIVELIVRRDRLRGVLPFRAAYREDADESEKYAAAYARANDPCWCRHEQYVPRGEFSTEIVVPAAANGACHVRVYVSGSDDCAAGAADVEIAGAPQ